MQQLGWSEPNKISQNFIVLICDIANYWKIIDQHQELNPMNFSSSFAPVAEGHEIGWFLKDLCFHIQDLDVVEGKEVLEEMRGVEGKVALDEA
jgi:hypothetical protein